MFKRKSFGRVLYSLAFLAAVSAVCWTASEAFTSGLVLSFEAARVESPISAEPPRREVESVAVTLQQMRLETAKTRENLYRLEQAQSRPSDMSGRITPDGRGCFFLVGAQQ